MNFYYQPGGEKGIIRWSLVTILFCIGIIIQFEIWKFNIIAPLIMIIALLCAIFLILKSKINIDTTTITIQNSFKKDARKINLTDIESIDFKGFYFIVNFKSKEFFPLRIVTTSKNIKKLKNFLG